MADPTTIVVSEAFYSEPKLRSQLDFPICVVVKVDARSSLLRFHSEDDARDFRETVVDELQRGLDLDSIAAACRTPLPTGPTTTR